MRKRSNMLVVCMWMVVIMFTCALLMSGLTSDQRIALLLASCGTAWVYMICESRVQRAHAPLILRDETMPEKSKPPEGNAE